MPGDPDHADALRQELHRLRHPDPEPLRRFNHDLRVRTAQAKIDDNLAALHAQPWRVETWTDTIERPDPDEPPAGTTSTNSTPTTPTPNSHCHPSTSSGRPRPHPPWGNRHGAAHA